MAGGRGCFVNSITVKLLSALLVCVCSYGLGYTHAKNKGEAALNALKVEHEEERREAAEAYGKALAATLEKYQREVARANTLDTELTLAGKTIAAKQQELQRKIKDVTNGSTHTFSLAFVRLFNNAIGATAPGAVSAPGGSGAAVDTGGTGTAAYPGILAGVSEADILAFINYYGARCQNLEAKERAWIGLAEGWAQ